MHKISYLLGKSIYGLLEKFIYFIVGLFGNLGLQSKAEYIGTFVITYLSLGGGFIFMCLMLGINPTLVMSVISAPIWIFIVYISNKITKVIVTYKEKEEEDVVTNKDSEQWYTTIRLWK